jgi:LmbE family N-acetylglucosaminyl deacetylase
MDDLHAIESLTRELELSRSEMSSLTDAMRLQAIRTEELTEATAALQATLEAMRRGDLLEQRIDRRNADRRGFRVRCVGAFQNLSLGPAEPAFCFGLRGK